MSEPLEYTIKQAVKSLELMVDRYLPSWEGGGAVQALNAIKGLQKELESMTRMFHAACTDLGLVNEALGLDPDDGGAEPILDAIQELKERVAELEANRSENEILAICDAYESGFGHGMKKDGLDITSTAVTLESALFAIDHVSDFNGRGRAIEARNMLVSLPPAQPEKAEDAELLDWLDELNRKTNERNGTVYGWKFDINHNRAALTDHNFPALSIRQAIRAAIAASQSTAEGD